MTRIAEYLFGTRVEEDTEPRRWFGRYLLLVIVIALIMICRRPDSILNPQFWAEDGVIYFSQQLTLGFWSALCKLWNGFPYVAPRLIALLGEGVPLAAVPLLYNASAIAISALAMATFSLPGFRHLVRSDTLRVAFCLAVVCNPAVDEVIATPTNLSWWLGLGLVLLSVMRAPRSPTIASGWCLSGVLTVFSTPFAPLAAPLWALRAVYGARSHRNRDLGFALAQLMALLALVATAGWLGAGDVLEPDGSLAAVHPGESFYQWHTFYLWSALETLPYVAAWCIDAAVLRTQTFGPLESISTLRVVAPTLVLTAGVGLAFRDLSERGRTTVCLATYLFLSSLFLTLAGRHNLVRGFQGLVPHLNMQTILFDRYRVLPDAALVLAAVGIIDGARRYRTRVASAIVACAALFAWAPEFRIPPLVDYHWPLWADRLERQLASGTENRLIIPINPKPYKIVLDLPVPPDVQSTSKR
jgi:hypothetical protein